MHKLDYNYTIPLSVLFFPFSEMFQESRGKYKKDVQKLLFRTKCGKVVTRNKVQEKLVQAAVALGAPAKGIRTHSLRIGGATALWNRYKDTALVQRWGRWKSQAFQGYLWDSRELARGVSQNMLKADCTLVGTDANPVEERKVRFA